MKRNALLAFMALMLLASFLTGCAATGAKETPGGEAEAGGETIGLEEDVPEPPKITGLQPTGVLSVEAGPKSVELMPGGERIFVNDLYAHKCFIFDARDYTPLKVISLPDEPVEADFSEGGRLAWVSQPRSWWWTRKRGL